ncbi:MAG TPA: HAMP domain-containing sensor histidine kinase [Thermomicrobiales bacterium]
MLSFFLFPALAYTVTNVFDHTVLQRSASQTPPSASALDSEVQSIAGSAANWHDPQWQASLRETLNTLGVGGVLRDPSGAEIFRTGTVNSGGHPPWGGVASQQATVLEGGQEIGTIELSVPQRDDSLARMVATIALVLAIIHAGWRIRRSVVQPLEAMGRAARRIAGGDLDFTLPTSSVREVADVRDAFETMGEGLRDSIERQAELEEERRFFIGAIAHDLRTPLFALRGSLVGLAQGLADSPEKAARYVAVCRQKADQLDRLVEDLFAYTKAEYLAQTIRHERLDFGSLMDAAIEGFRPQAQEKGVTITRHAPEDSPMTRGDAHLLGRVVENLLDNALRHTPSGGAVTVGWRAEPDRLVFTVADTGPGIAARDLPHLFDPLYRGEASRNRETGGAGLGLAIARRILHAHGGDLAAANRDTGGAEFTGWLPLP